MRLNQGIGACPTTGYLDFFDFAKSLDSSTYKGPKLPAVFMVSGLGSYESPFTIHYETDPYLKSLIFIDEKKLKNSLPFFFANLNSLLARLNFNKFTGIVYKDLDSILEHIDEANKSLFDYLGIKATLYLFDNAYSKETNEQLKRRSFPLDA